MAQSVQFMLITSLLIAGVAYSAKITESLLCHPENRSKEDVMIAYTVPMSQAIFKKKSNANATKMRC